MSAFFLHQRVARFFCLQTHAPGIDNCNVAFEIRNANLPIIQTMLGNHLERK
ncbi:MULTISPECIES: hypothetical protein [unclassified Rhizobium]|uniref:hypothetical protein n=1 Tax=unclassified Rhizobium TaxID=2613769 RepID=UPI0013AF0A32|nr:MULTISPECIES: hypothetical protein [unclassified Rhizobium]QYA16301.1 hypothetical protein J5284_30515 [Rhizobium sp. AB2/73]UEQ84844.1 hypothetical protein I8E17_26815 [Rhizobium sp. AB2/73]